MSDPFAKVTTGDKVKPSARWWNAVSDLARERDGGDTGGGGADFSRDADRIKIQNVTSANQPQFAILGIDVPAITPSNSSWQFNRWLVFNGVAPLSTNHAGKFVVLQQPLAVNSIGWGLVAGVTPVVLNTLSTTNQAFAEVSNNNSTGLQAGGSGSAQVLWVENTNSAAANAVVRLAVPPAAAAAAFSGCRVTNTGGQTINTNASLTLFAITFDTEDWDTDAYHSTASNTSKLIAPTTAKYLIGGQIIWPSNSVGTRILTVRKGGTEYGRSIVQGSSSGSQSLVQTVAPVEVRLTAGDALELLAAQDSGANLNTTASSPEAPVFWMERRDTT